MKSKLWIKKALTTCSMLAIIATYSMVALAGPGRAAGELMVIGASAAGTSHVTVNGEPVQSGRTVLSSSTIATPEGVGATVNLGKAGKLQFGPNTTFTLKFDDKNISGSLAAGSVTVLNATQNVSVTMVNGEVVQLNAGETATAGSSTVAKQTAKTVGGPDWWVWALIVGGASVGIIAAALANNDSNFGAGSVVVSSVQ